MSKFSNPTEEIEKKLLSFALLLVTRVTIGVVLIGIRFKEKEVVKGIQNPHSSCCKKSSSGHHISQKKGVRK